MEVGTSIVLSPEGKLKLEEELAWRETTERERITEAIAVARDFGDLSENSEYDDAKDEQASNENRIQVLKQQLANCIVVAAPTKGGRITIGHVVHLQDAAGKERVYTLVGTAEASPREGKISNESPLGKALMDHKAGDTVSFVSPAGKTLIYTVTAVEAR